MHIIWEELTYGLPDATRLAHVLLRLFAAMLLGALVGIEREMAGKPAGVRTHMLVTLGTTLFILAGASAGMSADAMSRIVQGVVTGIGFIGAGSILKLAEHREVHGLTTAASVWLAAAVGIAVGMGSLGLAVLGTVFTLGILSFALRVQRRIETYRRAAGMKPSTDAEKR